MYGRAIYERGWFLIFSQDWEKCFVVPIWVPKELCFYCQLSTIFSLYHPDKIVQEISLLLSSFWDNAFCHRNFKHFNLPISTPSRMWQSKQFLNFIARWYSEQLWEESKEQKNYPKPSTSAKVKKIAVLYLKKGWRVVPLFFQITVLPHFPQISIYLSGMNMNIAFMD